MRMQEQVLNALSALLKAPVGTVHAGARCALQVESPGGWTTISPVCGSDQELQTWAAEYLERLEYQTGLTGGTA